MVARFSRSWSILTLGIDGAFLVSLEQAALFWFLSVDQIWSSIDTPRLRDKSLISSSSFLVGRLANSELIGLPKLLGLF